MFVVYLLYFHDEVYMPAIGVTFRDENQYDQLIYSNLFHDKRIQRKMSKDDLAATRKTC
jgi:hypothetical protein